ncbi:MAG TPA: hypothetical protein VKZ18_15875 [Polyangia bacterium]|nr:hypothetical protein [Polyangia bacterium]
MRLSRSPFAAPPPRPANDNTTPVVRAPRRRPEATYAAAGNVILPLRFAERMPGWRRSR